jgi:hypothetical protein
MEEHHWTPEQISTQFTILQLMSLFGRETQHTEIQANNDEVIKNMLRKKGNVKHGN